MCCRRPWCLQSEKADKGFSCLSFNRPEKFILKVLLSPPFGPNNVINPILRSCGKDLRWKAWKLSFPGNQILHLGRKAVKSTLSCDVIFYF